MRLLADTHILLRWLREPKRLSREQLRSLEASLLRAEPVGISAASLLEIAILCADGAITLTQPVDEFFENLEANPALQILPITCAIAAEVVATGPLRVPADRAIVATARCHRLMLVTSDQRIIQSGLVRVIE